MTVYSVYRFFDSSYGLLYVGCTKNLSKRIDQHKSRAWWPQVVGIREDTYLTKAEALAVEKELIVSGQPKYNRLHHPYPGPKIEGVQLNVDVPETLHRQFKALAFIQGLTVKDFLLQVLTEAVEKGREQ